MGRIVIVSSWTHDPYHASSERHIRNKSHKTVSQDSKILAEAGEDDNKGGKYHNSGMRRYEMSKMLIVMFMYVSGTSCFYSPLAAHEYRTLAYNSEDVSFSSASLGLSSPTSQS